MTDKLDLARRLYVHTACGPELDALEVAKQKRDVAYRKFSPSRHRWDGRVAGAEAALRTAQERARFIFDAVINDGLSPESN